jgi:hypothetical protein
LLLPPSPPVKAQETKGDKLKAYLNQYGFFQLPKVSLLNDTNKERLINKITTNELPYAVAMFDYLGFFEHLEEQHFTAKYRMYKEVSKWFNSDKEGRAIKANISTLLKRSREDKKRYTAHLHKETVRKDYQNLK